MTDMDVWLQFEPYHDQAEDTLLIELVEYRKSNNDKWPTKRTVGRHLIRLKWCRFFGTSLPKKLNTIMYNMEAKYRKNIQFVAQLNQLCADFTSGRLIVSDDKTNRFVRNFRKN